MSTLENQILQLESFIKDADVINPKISKRGVDWHIEHTLRVLEEVCTFLNTDKAAQLSGNINLTGRILLALKYFPRGKARAPKTVYNKEEVIRENLTPLLNKIKIEVAKIPQLPDTIQMKHPYFNILNKKRTIRFLETHTHHHIKIIQDILNK